MQREKISSQNFQCFSLRKFHKEIFCFFAFSFALISTSCTNLASLASRAPTSEITLADPTAAGGGAFTLTSVLASQQSPGTMYDMVGADSQFDTYCSGTNAPCACEYTYISPGQGTVTDQGAVQYQESNLVRCLNVVPSGVNSFDVKVVATGSGDYSNTITVNLASGGFTNTNYTDLSKEEAYQQVKRFQCRRLALIPNPMSTNLIDPIQSVDPKIIYPFNFYTSNVASSLWQMQQSSNQNWDCSLTPTYDHVTNQRILHWWSNPNVFSSSACTDAFCNGDNELMYPQNSLESGKIPVTNIFANGKRRASFSLAKQSYGVFQIPVKAAVAPLSYVASNYGTIGYAARPIPNASGVSTCPNITIPSNASWVKLWNFKANNILPPRYVTGSIAINPANQQIGCYPRQGVQLSSCDNLASATTMETVGVSPIAGTLASRVVVIGSASGANACYNLDSGTMSAGQELWTPSTYADFQTHPTQQNMKDLPWGMYQLITGIGPDGSNVKRVYSSGSAIAPVIDPIAPKDSQLTVSTLTTANYNDNLFVVSDVSVNDSSMINGASSVSYYKPLTYKTNLDCTVINGASNPICSPSKMINWDINIKDVDAPTGPNQYPLCVLQFTD